MQKAYDKFWQANYFHLARPNAPPFHHSRIKFSEFQSTSVIEFIRKVLKEFKNTPPKALLPMFRGSEERANEVLTEGTRLQFWIHPDFQMTGLRVRVVRCYVTGHWQFIFNRPCTETQLNKHEHWAGNTIRLILPFAELLMKYMISKNQEYTSSDNDDDEEDEDNDEDDNEEQQKDENQKETEKSQQQPPDVPSELTPSTSSDENKCETINQRKDDDDDDDMALQQWWSSMMTENTEKNLF